MDRRQITAMIVAMALVFAWMTFVQYQYKQHPEWTAQPASPATQPAPVATTRPATTQPAGGGTAASPTTAGGAPATVPSAVQQTIEPVPAEQQPLMVRPAIEVTEAQIGSALREDPNYAIGLSVSPYGAGLAHVILNDFYLDRDEQTIYSFQYPYENHVARSRALASRSIKVDGTEFDLSQVPWRLENRTDDTATYVIDLAQGERPLVRLRKTFTVPKRDDPNLGFEIKVNHAIENLANRPVKVQTTINGTTTPPAESDRGPDKQVIAGYLIEGRIGLEHHPVENFTDDRVRIDLTKDEDGNRFAWFGTSGAYFNALVMPGQSLQAVDENALQIQSISSEALEPARDPVDRKVATTVTSNEVTIEAGQTAIIPMNVFLGPKKRSILKDPFYTAPPRQYDLTLIAPGGCGFCTFQPIVDALVWLLRAFHAITQDWGLAIICLVILVRLILHPITKRSTISMHKMGKMGPEMERLKKKYGDNKDELNRAMMQLYKEQGATPILGCLPMFLQMPIWIALWSALQSTYELRQAPFLYGWTWIDDLAKPDALIEWTPIPLLFGIKVGALNILPILLGLTFYLQQKFQPKPAAMTKEQEQQQKMMLFMLPFIFPLMLYSGPSGLNLYILTSTVIGIIESKRIRDHIQQREEAEKAGRIIVDARPTRASRDRKPAKPAETSKGGLAGWLADLQRKAEEMRDQQQKQQKRKDDK